MKMFGMVIVQALKTNDCSVRVLTATADADSGYLELRAREAATFLAAINILSTKSAFNSETTAPNLNHNHHKVTFGIYLFKSGYSKKSVSM